MSTRPAEILGLAKGQLEPGFDEMCIRDRMGIVLSVSRGES